MSEPAQRTEWDMQQRACWRERCEWDWSILWQLCCENSPVEKRTPTVPVHQISWFVFKNLKSNENFILIKKWKIQLWHRKDKWWWFSMMCFRNMMEKRTKFNTRKAIAEVRNWLTIFSFLKLLNLKSTTGCFVLWKGLKEIQYCHNRWPLPPKIMKTRWHEVL